MRCRPILSHGVSKLNSLCLARRRSYVTSWQSLLRTHELLGENRLKFSAQLGEMSDELVQLGKEVEKNRKSSKDLGTRLERGLAEQEALVDKARSFIALNSLPVSLADFKVALAGTEPLRLGSRRARTTTHHQARRIIQGQHGSSLIFWTFHRQQAFVR